MGATLLLQQLWNDLLITCLASVGWWMQVTGFLKFSTYFIAKPLMFLVRASHINALYSTSEQYSHSTSKSGKNDHFLYVAYKTVSFFEAMLKMYCTTFFFVFVFISFLMENDPPPHLKLERKKFFYSFEIIQTTPKMNLIFEVNKFLVSSRLIF